MCYIGEARDHLVADHNMDACSDVVLVQAPDMQLKYRFNHIEL
jgi:hypothetical protein